MTKPEFAQHYLMQLDEGIKPTVNRLEAAVFLAMFSVDISDII